MTEQEWLTSSDPLRMLTYLLVDSEYLERLQRYIRLQHGGQYRCLRPGITDRKLRLFACACVRQVEYAIDDQHSTAAIDAGEQFANGKMGHDELADFWLAANSYQHQGGSPQRLLRRCARDCAGEHLLRYPHERGVSGILSVIAGIYPEQRRVQATLLRDFFGNPFSPFIKPIGPVCTRCGGKSAVLNTEDTSDGWCRYCQQRSTFRWPWMEMLAWNNGLVLKMAQTIYEERRFEDMPILADAMEEAGCDNEAILNHCRGPRQLKCACGADWAPVKKNSLPASVSMCLRCHAEGPFWLDVEASRRAAVHVRGCWVIDLLLGKE